MLCPECHAATVIEDTAPVRKGRDRIRRCIASDALFKTSKPHGVPGERLIEWVSSPNLADPNAGSLGCELERPEPVTASPIDLRNVPEGAEYEHGGQFFKHGLRDQLFVWRVAGGWSRATIDSLPDSSLIEREEEDA